MSVHNLITYILEVSMRSLSLFLFSRYCNIGKRIFFFYTAIFLSMEFIAAVPEIVLVTLLVSAMFSSRVVILLHGLH